MTIHRKLVFQVCAVLLAIPLLYVASLGPALCVSYHCNNGKNATSWHIYKLYSPLRRLAAATSLQKPLYAYMKLWHVPIIRVAGKTGTGSFPPWPPRAPSTPVPEHR